MFSLSWGEFQFVQSAKWVKHNLHYYSQLKTHITKHKYSKLFLQSNFAIKSSIFQHFLQTFDLREERFTTTKLYILYCELKFEVTSLQALVSE